MDWRKCIHSKIIACLERAVEAVFRVMVPVHRSRFKELNSINVPKILLKNKLALYVWKPAHVPYARRVWLRISRSALGWAREERWEDAEPGFRIVFWNCSWFLEKNTNMLRLRQFYQTQSTILLGAILFAKSKNILEKFNRNFEFVKYGPVLEPAGASGCSCLGWRGGSALSTRSLLISKILEHECKLTKNISQRTIRFYTLQDLEKWSAASAHSRIGRCWSSCRSSLVCCHSMLDFLKKWCWKLQLWGVGKLVLSCRFVGAPWGWWSFWVPGWRGGSVFLTFFSRSVFFGNPDFEFYLCFVDLLARRRRKFSVFLCS